MGRICLEFQNYSFVTHPFHLLRVFLDIILNTIAHLTPNSNCHEYIVWFDEVGLDDVALVGGKNSSLGEMICNLKQLGIQVPFGFAITTHAYQYFLEYNNLVEQIKNSLKDVNYDDHVDLCRTAQKIRLIIKNVVFHKDLEI